MADHSRPQPSSSSAPTTNTTSTTRTTPAAAPPGASYPASTSSTAPLPQHQHQHIPPTTTHRRGASQSSDEGRHSLKSSSSISGPRRSSTKALSPHRDGSSRNSVGASSSSAAAMQRSASPSEQPTKYTKTGRISKAKKGLKVHLCEACGKSYTRAEHLRRHQQNHSDSTLQCDWPGCGKTFHRTDLLERHRERHQDPSQHGDDETRRSSVASRDSFMSGGAVTPAPPATQPGPRPVDAQSYPVASSGMESAMPASTSSAPNMKYHSTQSFARTEAPIGAVDLIHTGSIFNDYRWNSPPPEYPVGNSDYASPGHVTQYPNDFAYVPHPYPAYRPRTLSNASFMEAWAQPAAPRSPASAASTQPFYWLDVDRADQSHTSFSGSSGVPSYATSDTSIYNYAAEHQQMQPSSYFSTSTTASYRSFDDLDTEEYRLLFPPQPLGIPSIDPQQMIEHLDKYWQAFHPHFPIKHRPTFVISSEKPLCLAAMMAMGAQYSSVVGARAESRMLHERCLKALAKREHEGLPTNARICDMQAVFLIEILSQFRGKRASNSLSATFQGMFRSLAADHSSHPTVSVDSLVPLPPHSDDIPLSRQWTAWIAASEKIRLLTACAILEAQVNTLLVRQVAETTVSGLSLPRPAPLAAWDAPQWTWRGMLPRLSDLSLRKSGQQAAVASADGEILDEFQAAQAIWMHNGPDDADDSLDSNISSKATRLAIHGIRLASSTPLRALLAVAGETWVFSEKVRSDEHAVAKESVKQWTNSLNDPSAINSPQQARVALEEALAALRLGADTSTVDACSALPPGAEIIFFYASLVLWAAVAAISYSRSPFTLTPPLMPPSAQQQNADAAVFAIRTFLAEEATRSVATIDIFLQTWRDGIEAVLDWVCEALSGPEAPGELIGGCVRVTEGLRRKGWAIAWF
ncbi:Zinc finger C2H2-type protein [Macrophomina phaseolina MS6]|uniref:Zinc finger C2H2-type protein n=1 Tax=Macrophomina phaseolina (strain MS6) TaxID=1126212 RepID=K2RP64_MACPH|nr:Zinc finger C2H2-type protein [Macrophomina phaseolina MS6]